MWLHLCHRERKFASPSTLAAQRVNGDTLSSYAASPRNWRALSAPTMRAGSQRVWRIIRDTVPGVERRSL